MDTEKDTLEKLKKVTNQITKDYDQNNIANFLSSNVIEFEHEDQKYRVSKPTFVHKQDTYEQKNKKYMELLKNDIYLLEDDLKKTYLNKGIDVDAIQTKIDLLSKEFDRLSLKLGEAIKKKLSEKEINIYEEELTKVDDQIKELSVKKTNYLEYSIESQVMIFECSYLIYLITEKFVSSEDGKEDKWIKVWNSYNEKMQEKDETLINTVTFHACFVIRGEV